MDLLKDFLLIFAAVLAVGALSDIAVHLFFNVDGVDAILPAICLTAAIVLSICFVAVGVSILTDKED